MKICYLANSASVHTQRWATHFARQGHQVSVVSLQPGQIEGVEVVQLPIVSAERRLNTLLNLGRIRRLVRQMAPDILHAHYVTSYGLAGALTGWRPLVITAWGSDVLVTPEESWVYRQMVHFALGRADLVTSMAEHMTQLLLRRRYVAPDKLITLPFGVDTAVFNPGQRTRQHPDHPSLVVSTRNMDEGLDVHLFIQAIPPVLKRFPETRFVVAGDGPLRGSLEQMAADLGIAANVEFRGKIPHAEMPKLLGQMDVFVSTSRSDGNNVSLNEAMACGAFPVATDIPANRAWVQSGVNGLLFPCQDTKGLAQAIIEALQQTEWRRRVMAQNWDIVRMRASWTNEMKRMDEWYARLCQDQARRRGNELNSTSGKT